jgi:hypothetical protein
VSQIDIDCGRGSVVLHGAPDWVGAFTASFPESVVSHRPYGLEITGPAEVLTHALQWLAERRVAFAYDYKQWADPQSLMTQWQGEGTISTSFLKIAWLGREEWVLHEMVPGAVQWELTNGEDLITKPPIPLSKRQC